MLVWTEAAGAPMGSEVEAGAAEIEIVVACGYGPLIEVLVVKDGEVAARFGRDAEEGFDAERMTFRAVWRDPEFRGESCYYVRATHVDWDQAWSSPIWIRPK